MKNGIVEASLAACLLALLVLSGCGKDEGPECYSNQDCRGDDVCLDGECVHLGECLTDEHCPRGAACIQGVCVVRATPDDCVSDSECQPPSTICAGGSCVAGCGTTGCAPGERCESSTGRCVPHSGCVTDLDCNPPHTVCAASGECVAGCGTTGCPSGYACDHSTGRCRPSSTGCVTDADCEPPGTICDPLSGDCVAGCVSAGCPVGFSCDEPSGRCTEDQSPECSFDGDCDPPHTICDADSGECVPGCSSAGCPEGWDCDEPTGRCENLSPDCTFDQDCSPPETICNAGLGECVPGCLDAGCPDDWVCDDVTGRCELREQGCVTDEECGEGHICEDHDCVEGCRSNSHCPDGELCDEGACVPHCMESPCQSPMLCDPWTGYCEAPGTVPKGGSCLDQSNEPDHSLCASDYCFPGSGTCTKPCTASMQCSIPDWQCLNVTPMGARACGFNAGTGSGAPGDPCSAGCKTHWCWDDKCTDDCQHDRDCPQPGYVCRVIYTGEHDVPICATPTGGAGSTGSSCGSDSQCARELCLGGRCADPCHTSFDCPAGFVCTLVPATAGSAVRLCLAADGPVGHEGPGASCDPDTGLPCRSGLCVDLGGAGFCTDTCATHADCGGGMRCEILPIDTTGDGGYDQTVPVCLFR